MPTAEADLSSLRQSLKSEGGDIADFFLNTTAALLIPNPASPTKNDKIINDPIWKIVRLDGTEVDLLNLPLLQRLRRVRQLGLAYLVYPSAHHTRLEHSIGALQAATLVLNRLMDAAGVADFNERQQHHKTVRHAALLHDTGHAAFSHVSEYALNHLPSIQSSFRAIQRTLDAYFKDPMRELIREALQRESGIAGHNSLNAPTTQHPAVSALSSEPIPISELISVLFILSPALQDFFLTRGLSADHILRVAAFVLGKPYRLQSHNGQRYFDFLKHIISGDLDADKLDYVARDAYFTGIPIAADVDRLISQFDAAPVPIPTQPNSPSLPTTCDLFGILPSGVSAAEIFIITRSYLFDRIYQHPKIRVAEGLLQRVLVDLFSTISLNPSTGSPLIARFVDLLFGASGDDGCLHVLSNWDDPQHDHIASLTKRILHRRLPERALMVSQRTSVGYYPDRRSPSRPLQTAWINASEQIKQNSRELEAIIRNYASLDNDSLVFIDPPRKNPIKENPQLFVADRYSAKIPFSIDHYFDAAQLSRAYEDIKRVYWVFSDHDSRPAVCAAAAMVLSAKFGLVPNQQAAARGKVTYEEFVTALKERIAHFESKGDQLEVDLLQEVLRLLDGKLILPGKSLVPYFPLDSYGDSVATAYDVGVALAHAGLKNTHLRDVEAALPVLQYLIRHMMETVPSMGRHLLSLKEREFQESVSNYLRNNETMGKDFDIDEQQLTKTGKIDLVIRGKSGASTRVAVELKSEARSFKSILDSRLLQPFHYISDPQYSRVGILYCRFRSDTPIRPASCIQVRQAGDSRAPLAMICLGQQVTTAPASRIKKRSRRAPT